MLDCCAFYGENRRICKPCAFGMRHATRCGMQHDSATIVIVDDDPETVEFLCDYLAVQGFAPVGCPPGSELVSFITEQLPQLVLLDLRLEGIGGVTLFQQLRAHPATSTVPVIFFTGSDLALRQQLPDYASQGAQLVLKPKTDQLLAQVRAMIQR